MTQGDHVRALKGGVWDHAIDVGDRTVIRFARGAGIERCGYADFVAGADRVEVVVHRERVYRPALVVDRAFSRFAESAYAGMFRSPEQFAVWCKAGRLPADGAPAGPAPRASRGAAAPGPGRKPALSARRAPGKAAARRAAPKRSRPAPRKRAKAGARRAGRAAPRKAPPRRRAPRKRKRR
jgi:hypothetical protein